MGSRRAKAKRGFGEVDTLPSGRFRARYSGPDGARHSAPITFVARIDAEGWLVDQERMISTVDLTGQVNAQQRAHDLAQQAGRTAANQVQGSQIMRGQSPQSTRAQPARRRRATSPRPASTTRDSRMVASPLTVLAPMPTAPRNFGWYETVTRTDRVVGPVMWTVPSSRGWSG
jgi:hypothetical protein